MTNPFDYLAVPWQADGTGHDLPDGGRPLGSVIVGPFVWHVVEVQP